MYDYKSLVPSSLERVSDCPITLSVISWPRLLTELINSSFNQGERDQQGGICEAARLRGGPQEGRARASRRAAGTQHTQQGQ